MLQVHGLAKSFGGQTIFEDISFLLSKGEKVGLVGRNGSGKSTLFKVLIGTESHDSGQVQVPKNYKIGHLEQHISFSKTTVLEECVQDLSEHEKFDNYKVEKILFGLGFSAEDMQKSPTSFSGGYQIRINLAKTLVKAPDLLLLDEPTNYLDIISIRWLRSFLRNFAGEVIIITHDREFMDSVSTHTMGINRKSVKKVKGQTEKYYQQLLMDDEIYEKTRANLDRKKQHLESFVDKFRAKASKATQAQSKIKQLQKMEQLDELEKGGHIGLKFKYEKCPGKIILEIEHYTFDYNKNIQSSNQSKTLTQTPMINDFSMQLGRNEKIAIIGKNGKGKSTLLNLIADELKPWQGTKKTHPAIKQGLFGQTNIQRLHLNHSIIEEIQATNTNLTNSEVRAICGAMMFEGDLAKKQISVLSGGEKSRVLLGKILAYPTNILLLDEPTNHLDMETIDALTDQIKNYPGAVIVVTHSEALLRNIAEKLIIFHRGGVEYFNGRYDEFLEKIGWEDEAVMGTPKKKKVDRKELKRLRADLILEKSRALGPLKKKLVKLENNIEQWEQEKDKTNEDLIVASENSDGKEIEKLSQQLSFLDGELEKGYLLYEEITQTIDTEENIYQSKLTELE